MKKELSLFIILFALLLTVSVTLAIVNFYEPDVIEEPSIQTLDEQLIVTIGEPTVQYPIDAGCVLKQQELQEGV